MAHPGPTQPWWQLDFQSTIRPCSETEELWFMNVSPVSVEVHELGCNFVPALPPRGPLLQGMTLPVYQHITPSISAEKAFISHNRSIRRRWSRQCSSWPVLRYRISQEDERE